ncbi:unnamed protein product [Kluyveromyces dobzhanskii CBS 2104]|uniref:WGS project CCBQ000000000 data, contig MAT n=1 Tax=Kluyveromyces dobzhanskii CBS 2104 TaxID=1427455 RepID=A0A0A8L3L8_9SACH|nr:unnamed protein product [Kluyveromyces dobzhanskii CBS 2104]
MSAADLELRRTLTDVVDDELRIHNANPMALDLGFAETHHDSFPQLARTQATSYYNGSHAHAHAQAQAQVHAQHYLPHAMYAGQEQLHLSDEDSGNEMFNKYADPNLTTLDKKSGAAVTAAGAPIVKQVNLNLTPVQPTVSLNTITPNPFTQSLGRFPNSQQNNFASGISNQRFNSNARGFNFQTRINDENGLEDEFLNEGYGDFNNLYEDDEKLTSQATLWDDQNVSGYYWTNDQDTLSRFDQEFNFDDDISDEDEEDEDAEEDEEYEDLLQHQQEPQQQPQPLQKIDDKSCLKADMGQHLNEQLAVKGLDNLQGEFSDIEEMSIKSNDESLFMDTHQRLIENQHMDLSQVTVPRVEPIKSSVLEGDEKLEEEEEVGNEEGDDEDDAMFSEDDEDPLYEPALVSPRRKPSMVISQPNSEKQKQLLSLNSRTPTNVDEPKAEENLKSNGYRSITRNRGNHQRGRSLDELSSPAVSHSRSNSHTQINHMHNHNDEHICMVNNPVTNEPCSKKFSRPYDLIRHQKTIHASKKKIFRCLICIQELGSEGYQRTFSRNDALSRHVKVKHNLQGAEAQRVIQFAKDNVEYQTS